MVETIGGARVAQDVHRAGAEGGQERSDVQQGVGGHHGYDLLKLAKEHGVSYLFEASVGGGIPIIRPLNQCLAANEISEICGILNGTTNYILTRMIKAGLVL